MWMYHQFLQILFGCTVFEDLSSVCHGIVWHVPW
jgi:hypothetical protein